MNDDFINDAGLADELMKQQLDKAPDTQRKGEKPEDSKPGKKNATQKAAPTVKPPAAKEIDPEEDRDNWPVITIDFEDGKGNFEFLAVSGTLKDGRPFTHQLQVQRGVEVPVPPSIVYMLRNAQETRFSQADLSQDIRRTKRAGLPWQLVKGGKYC